MTEKIPENEAIMGQYKGIARTIANNGEPRYYGEDLETGKKTVRLTVKGVEDVEDAFHLKELEKKHGTYEKHKAAHPHEQTTPETSNEGEWVTDPDGKLWHRLPNPDRRLIKLEDEGGNNTRLIEPSTYEAWQKAAQPLEKLVIYDKPRKAMWHGHAGDQEVTVLGEYEPWQDGKVYCKIAESETGIMKDELEFLPGEEFDTEGYPKKGNWQPQKDELQEGVTVHGQRKSDGWYDVETVNEVGGKKRRPVPPEEVNLVEDAIDKAKVEELREDVRNLTQRIEELERHYQEQLAAKDNKIENLKKQLAEAKKGGADRGSPVEPTSPEATPKNPDEEWLKNLLGAPVDYQPSPGRVERDWSLASADIIEEDGKQYVTLGRTGIRDNFQEKQRVLLADLKAWMSASKAYEDWKPPYGTGWYFNRAKKAKDGGKKSHDLFGWLKLRKGENPDDEEEVRKSKRGYPLGALAAGAAIGALAVTTGALLIEELTDDESNASTNEINIIQNGNQQQNVVVTGEGQMGPYKVRIMPNPAPRHNTTTTETETTPTTPSTTTETAPSAPSTTEAEPQPTTTTETTPQASTTTETTPEAATTETTPEAATTETTPTGSTGQEEPGGAQVNEEQLHGMHLEHYNLENGHGFVEVNLPQELNLIQPQEGGPYYITNAAGEPIVENVRYETTGLLNEASREALENNGYKVDYQRNAVFDNGQEVENYMSVITPA